LEPVFTLLSSFIVGMKKLRSGAKWRQAAMTLSAWIFLPLRLVGLFFGGLSLTALPLTTRRASVVSDLLSTRRAYFRFLYPLMLTNSSGMADFSFRPAFR
jgi:hypothetical protein